MHCGDEPARRVGRRDGPLRSANEQITISDEISLVGVVTIGVEKVDITGLLISCLELFWAGHTSADSFLSTNRLNLVVLLTIYEYARFREGLAL